MSDTRLSVLLVFSHWSFSQPVVEVTAILFIVKKGQESEDETNGHLPRVVHLHMAVGLTAQVCLNSEYTLTTTRPRHPSRKARN